MVDFEHERLADPSLAQHFERISDVSKHSLEKDGRVVGHFYWRAGYGYHDRQRQNHGGASSHEPAFDEKGQTLE